MRSAPAGPALELGAMPPIPELARELYAEEVNGARAMAPDDKLLEGPRLFDRACRLMVDGIRHRHPGLDDEAVQALLREQLDRVRALERS